MFLDKGVLSIKPYQLEVSTSALNAKIFLEGPAGVGKTTAAVERMLYLMAEGVPGNSILLVLPQRTLGGPYLRALAQPGVLSGGLVSILTMNGLAQRMVDLFWPIIAAPAGFGLPNRPPVFLTLETAQYYLAHLAVDLLDQGYFESVTIERNRLFSQVLDNLNKAAVVGFPPSEIGDRLKEAWIGEPGQRRVYDDVQELADLFRNYCLAHNLLDFSLQIEIFWKHLWNLAICRDYLMGAFRHLIFDNIEEDTPFAHQVIEEWLPGFDSALIVYDWMGGYRRFLGADPSSAYSLINRCERSIVFTKNLVMSPDIEALEKSLGRILLQPITRTDLGAGVREIAESYTVPVRDQPMHKRRLRQALIFEHHRYYPEMLDWVAEGIAALIHDEGLPPSQIVILAPYLSDALRFSLLDRLQARQVPVRSYRPSRALREEPAMRCLLTLAILAYPEWQLIPEKSDVAYALFQSIQELDLVRAQLLTEKVYRKTGNSFSLSSFDEIIPAMQMRITYRLGERFEMLRGWLAQRREPPDELDHFLGRLFGEVLSQPGFGFHQDYIAGQVAANLIESIQKFRWVAGKMLQEEGIPLGREYIHMIQQGVIAAQYIRSWQEQDAEAVLIAPAFTFLMGNQPVEVQFWLDAGSHGWSERLNQPLTHPYVLSQNWRRGQPWTDFDELKAGQEVLYSLALGLLHRCRQRVYLGLSELGEQGYEARGPLLQALQRALLAADSGE
jgi:hypothetical protein